MFTAKERSKKLDNYPQMINAHIECRLVRVELENGEIEILCTSLIDKEKYSCSDFEQLYHYRWNEEEA